MTINTHFGGVNDKSGLYIIYSTFEINTFDGVWRMAMYYAFEKTPTLFAVEWQRVTARTSRRAF